MPFLPPSLAPSIAQGFFFSHHATVDSGPFLLLLLLLVVVVLMRPGPLDANFRRCRSDIRRTRMIGLAAGRENSTRQVN